MDQETGVSVFVVRPPADPAECLAHHTGNGVKLPKATVDITRTSLQDAAKQLLKNCPAVTDWEITNHTETYSYTYGGAAPVRKTGHAFLVVATESNKRAETYQWVPISNATRVFSYGAGVVREMDLTLDSVGLATLGVSKQARQQDSQLTPEGRAAKADQSTTLTDFDPSTR